MQTVSSVANTAREGVVVVVHGKKVGQRDGVSCDGKTLRLGEMYYTNGGGTGGSHI